MLKNKKILLGVTGSIAAYKICWLIRLLKQQSAQVRVIMTESARQFVTPLTFSVLSQEKVFVDLTSPTHWENHHIALAEWADIFVIAPCSANTLSKLHYGLSDNLLSLTYLCCACPVLIAPAMDGEMAQHPAIVEHLATLEKRPKHTLLPMQEGFLASGQMGKGRLAEPEELRQAIERLLYA